MSELFIGLMSGTSVDAIDAVLMDFSKSNTHVVSYYNQPIDSSLRQDINLLIAKNKLPINYGNLDQQFANASCKAVKHLLDLARIETKNILAIGSHGQTVFHDPKGTQPVSIQIGNSQHIAKTSGIPTVGNFRQADINVGGQGAPLACAYHSEVLQSSDEERVVLNLGGIANITKLPKDKTDSIIGFDTGPASTLMDAWTMHHLNKPYDENGAWAQSGTTNSDLLEQMLEDDYFVALPPKSTGREHFNLKWLGQQLERYGEKLSPKDVQATLLALTAHTIVDSIKKWCPKAEKVLLCGGGSENKFLVQNLEKLLEGKTIQNTDEYGVPTKWMEAMAFAWLAKLNLENKPGNIPSVTGAAKAVTLGEYKDVRI